MKLIRYAACVAAVMIVAACASQTPVEQKTTQYVLEYPAPVFDSLDTLDVAIKVSRFNIAAAYNSLPLVYREGAFERKTYTYHQWRDNPADLVGDFLIRDLRASGAFRLVLRPETNVEARFRLEGDIEELYELDTDEKWYAVLTVVMTLLDEEAQDITRRVMFQKTFTEKQICGSKGPKAVVQAMSEAMRAFSTQFIPELYEALKLRLAEDAPENAQPRK